MKRRIAVALWLLSDAIDTYHTHFQFSLILSTRGCTQGARDAIAAETAAAKTALEDRHTRQAVLCKTSLLQLQHSLIWLLWNVQEANHMCAELANHVTFDAALLVRTTYGLWLGRMDSGKEDRGWASGGGRTGRATYAGMTSGHVPLAPSPTPPWGVRQRLRQPSR